MIVEKYIIYLWEPQDELYHCLFKMTFVDVRYPDEPTVDPIRYKAS
jgi:hypothetical protein